LTLAGLLEKTEKTALVDALRLSHGHVAEAAEVLAIPVKTLYDKLARYGIQAGAFKT
jgi:two-component system C4-dicarboxylate transport response regulator DctD